MRILHTSQSYLPEANGVADVVRNISTRLVERGHEVCVATGRPPKSLPEESVEGVKVVRFAVQGNLVRGMSGELERYQRFVVNGRWDIVAMHCAQIWTTDGLLDIVRNITSPFVLVSHGLPAWQNSAYAEYFDLLGAALRESAQVVSLSPMLEEGAFCAKYGLTPPCVIVNGVNLSEWAADSLGVRNRWGVGSRPWLLSVGNHSSVKGHERFQRLRQNLRKHHHDVHCTIIGRSHPAERWGLGRLGIPGGCWLSCRLRSLVSRVELRKDVSRRDVVAAIKEASVVAITSRREACPVVAIEAMAAGTPWVSFDVGNVRENVGGFVVSDEKALLSKVLFLLKNPGICKELGAEGQARARTAHNWDKIVNQYEQVYMSAISRQTPAGVGRKV